jgi:hypothetical protein
VAVEGEAAGDNVGRDVGRREEADLMRGGLRPGDGEGQVGPGWRCGGDGGCVGTAYEGVVVVFGDWMGEMLDVVLAFIEGWEGTYR